MSAPLRASPLTTPRDRSAKDERLVRDGLLEMRHGQGTFVAANAHSTGLAVHRNQLVEELRQWARQGLALGLGPEELHELMNEALQQLQLLTTAEKEVP